MSYIKETFEVTTLENAKHVALTNDPNNPNKFEEETNHVILSLSNEICSYNGRTWLDYGCGMGRISLGIIRQFADYVTGYDTSQSMLYFAKKYIPSELFIPTMKLPEKKNTFDCIVSAFCLQHVEDVAEEVENISQQIKPTGTFILINEKNRFVPTKITDENYVVWEDDGVNVFEEVEKKFALYKSVPYVKGSNLNINFYNRRT
tara:strand:+ start:926 stop:1537 length:612 start_codon:yes stop_codon:yes gene_type:complete